MAAQQIHCYNIQLVYKEHHTQVQKHYHYQISFLLIMYKLAGVLLSAICLGRMRSGSYKVPVCHVYPESPDIQSVLTSK